MPKIPEIQTKQLLGIIKNNKPRKENKEVLFLMTINNQKILIKATEKNIRVFKAEMQ